MRIEFRLKQILEAAGLLVHGIYARIAAEAGIDRKTVRDICENRRRTIKLDTLERLCGWLRKQNLGEGLPGALFGFRPSRLLAALAEPGRVTIYEAERRHRGAGIQERSVVSRDDISVGATFDELLSGLDDDPQDNGRRARVRFTYVPGGPTAAGGIFKRMRSQRAKGSTILIGSQLAHGLTELFVAEIFKCEAFSPAPGKVPFYLRFADKAPVTSCFGGTKAPPGYKASAGPGIYYQAWSPTANENVWVACPSTRGREDAGVVIVRRHSGEARTEMAVFGFSGQATAALGTIIRHKPDEFWDFSDNPRRGLEVRVYICTFEMTEAPAGQGGAVFVKNEKIIPLHSSLLPAA